MSSTTTALTPAELALLREGARRWVSPYMWDDVEKPPASGLIELLVTTGIHPSRLCRGHVHDVRILGNSPRWTLQWSRPKMGGGDGVALFPVDSRLIIATVRHLQVHPMGTRSLLRMVASIGQVSGIAGVVSARTLRHTAVVEALRKGTPMDDVQVSFGVCRRSLLAYVRQAGVGSMEDIP